VTLRISTTRDGGREVVAVDGRVPRLTGDWFVRDEMGRKGIVFDAHGNPNPIKYAYNVGAGG
jgi:hypothetical protein